MSSPPDFEYEVFISYAHLDNSPLLDGEKGWVTQFDELLDILLGQYLGSEARIWRDNMLRGDDIVQDAINMQLPRIAVMVSILSPRYIKSRWCLWEVSEFCRSADASGGFRIGNKARIYKVVKTPIRHGEPPPIFKELKGYNFFQVKDKDDRPREFGVEFGAEAKKNFLDRVGDVAYDIANLLDLIRNRPQDFTPPEPDNPPPQNKNAPPDNNGAPPIPVIYLAEPTPDLAIQHANIKRDLLERNYKVLPEQSLPSESAQFLTTAREDLKACHFSIHLIGEAYGESPADDHRSYTYLQNMLAAEREKEPDFSRLIWMPKGNKPDDLRQWSFVKELFNAPTAGRTDLLQTTLEDFKTAIQDTIKSLNKKKRSPEQSAGGEARTIYIVCDKPDMESMGVFDTYLLSMGYETYLPSTSNDDVTVRRTHEENLLKCDAVLIYWNSAPKLWVLTKLEDLQKARGYGRHKSLLSKAVYIAGEATQEKERFRARDALVIRNFGEVSSLALDNSLAPFIREIENVKEDDARENF